MNLRISNTFTASLARLPGENPTEDDECQQHWQTVQMFVDEVAQLSEVEDRIAFLYSELVRAQQTRSKIYALPIPSFEDQVRELKAALSRFEELAELKPTT